MTTVPGDGAQGPFRVILGLVRACHPEPTVAVTAFSMALALGTGRSAAGVAAVGGAVLVGQLSVGWHNDWLDSERDKQARRRDKPLVAGRLSRELLGWACATATAAVVPLSLLSGWRAALAHLGAVALALAYNMWLKATLASVVAYGAAFPLLVAFITLGGTSHPWPAWWALVGASLLACGAHLVNAAPDLADDLAAGVRGLPQRLGYRRSVRVAGALMLAATATVAAGPGLDGWLPLAAVGLASAVLASGVVLGRPPGSRWLFRAALAVAFIDVVVLVGRGHLA